MLSIARIVNIKYYLKKARRRRRGSSDDPDSPDGTPMDSDPDTNSYSGLCDGGEWWGSGTPLIGLLGAVKPQDLEALFKGFGPDGSPLVQNAGAKNRQKGWDLTYSVPKSLSVLWTQVSHETRLRISQFIRQATIVALTYLATVAMLTRRGKGGKIIEPALPIVAIFRDPTSWELDPQIHDHCVLLNVAGRADGTFGTILSKCFYRAKLTAGALFQAELAHLLHSHFGLKLEQAEHGFRVAGVPEKLIDHYSTRSKQLRAILRSKGLHSAKAAAIAALDTRKPKAEAEPSLSDLLNKWQKTNAEFGFTEARAQRLIGRASALHDPPALRKRIVQAMQDLLETESFFSEQQLVRQVARTVVAEGIAAKEIIDQVRAYLLEGSGVVPLGNVDHEPLFTTQEILVLEGELRATINNGKNDTSHVIKKSIVERLLDEFLPLGPHLTDDELIRNQEQRAAVLTLLTNPGNFKVLEGMAGTGKTYVLSVVRRILKKLGFRVVGVALSAVAAANLQEGSGINSDTLAMRLIQLDSRGNFARHHQRQLKRLLKGQRTYAYRGPNLRLDKKTILVFDEAAMVGTRQFAKVVKHAQKAGAKIIAVGDRRQLQPIEAGGPFPMAADMTDKAELRHVVRQQVEPDDPNPKWHRHAGELIAAGHIPQAIRLFKERGRFRVLADRAQATLSMVRDWSVEGIANPFDNQILAGLRAEVTEINVICQSARMSAGFLGSQYIAVGDYHIHEGDIVVLRKNSRLYQVKNGDRGVVLGFNWLTGTMAVRLSKTSKTVFIPYRIYTDIQLGYALTTHLAQGSTVPSVYVLLGGPMQDRHLSYVQATRACESTRLYVDKHNAGPDLKQLFGQMAKLRPKRLAHDILSANDPPPTSESPPSNDQSKPAGSQHSKASGETNKEAGKKKVTPTAPTKREQSVTGPNNKSASPSKRDDLQVPQQAAQTLRNAADQSRNASPNVTPSEGNTSSSHVGVQTNGQVAKPVRGTDQQSSAHPSSDRRSAENVPSEPATEARKIPRATKPKSNAATLDSRQGEGAAPPKSVLTPIDLDISLAPAVGHSSPQLNIKTPPLQSTSIPRERIQAPTAEPVLQMEPRKSPDSYQSTTPIYQPFPIEDATSTPQAKGFFEPSPQPISSSVHEPTSSHSTDSPNPNFTPPSNAFVSIPTDGTHHSHPPRETPSEPGAWTPSQTVRNTDPLDLPYIKVEGITDPHFIEEARQKYGTVPGGIVVEGEADCSMPIHSIAIDPTCPTQVILNGTCRYDTRLSAEEVALLWWDVLEDGRAATTFGALSQRDTVGTEKDTVIAVTMMLADTALGRFIFGFDAQHKLETPTLAGYENPFVAEIRRLGALAESLERRFANIVLQISPRVFLTISKAHFVEEPAGVLAVSSINVTPALGVITADGKVVTSIAGLPHSECLVAERYPDCYGAFQILTTAFSAFARTAPCVARTIAYGQLVLLFRRARAAGARLSRGDSLIGTIIDRQRVAKPRLDFTLRSNEFANLARSAATVCRDATGTTSSLGLMNAVVGFDFARLAGDLEIFLDCKRKAFECAQRLRAAPLATDKRGELIHRRLSFVEKYLAKCTHDVVVDGCIAAAFEQELPEQERTLYLTTASQLFAPARIVEQDPVILCHQIAVSSYLSDAFDPIPHFALARRQHPHSFYPYFALEMFHTTKQFAAYTYRSEEQMAKAIERGKVALEIPRLSRDQAALWRQVETPLSTRRALWLVDELRRFNVSVPDFLRIVQSLPQLHPINCLLFHLAMKLKKLPPTEFSPELLHRNNPFVATHQLLYSDTADALAHLLSTVREKIEVFDRPCLIELEPQIIRSNSPEAWWHRFLRDHARSPDTDASELGVLLANELHVRGANVSDLISAMSQHGTANPQAALFYLDAVTLNFDRASEAIAELIDDLR